DQPRASRSARSRAARWLPVASESCIVSISSIIVDQSQSVHPRMRTWKMLIRDATEADLPGILAIYNDVIATSSAVYTETPSTPADRQAWFAARRAGH